MVSLARTTHEAGMVSLPRWWCTSLASKGKVSPLPRKKAAELVSLPRQARVGTLSRRGIRWKAPWWIRGPWPWRGCACRYGEGCVNVQRRGGPGGGGLGLSVGRPSLASLSEEHSLSGAFKVPAHLPRPRHLRLRQVRCLCGVKVWRMCGQGVAKVWRRCGEGVAKVWPRCGKGDRTVVKMWRRRG